MQDHRYRRNSQEEESRVWFEFFMINRAFKAMKRADTVVLMLDAVDGIVDQIASSPSASPTKDVRVIALNKWV